MFALNPFADLGHATHCPLARGIRLAALATAMGLAGCAAQPGADLPPFGDTVQHTKRLQTHEPGDDAPALGGAKAAEAMRNYRSGGAGLQPLPMSSSSLP
ncbi:hypothetical protein [Billgrantia desiderata]|uniref:Uncharacterized protein n=1 Tax=Billgrantia desiderata TaxID=52021 RepID=A0ABS9B714_9GAMM|nr:hypothetical protein [Halomonas desiderata]MCE8043191.1 hypothetical protein [Halomonas desiderata]MCE8047712.1 hypothetical protein [Halomonas desiderata]